MADLIDPTPILELQKGWLAVDKPCGLSVHNDPGNDLVSIMADRIRSDALLANSLGVPKVFHVHPVHRLDKETSGVILLATDNLVLKNLSEQFIKGTVKKKYLALVHGNFDPELICKGYQVWDTFLSKTAGGRNNPIGKGKRVNCTTLYKVLRQSLHYALLEIKLLTGRKHQIRRHAKIYGHPVICDTRYGSKKSIQYLKDTLSYQRLGLHCNSLEFVLPGQKNQVCITSQNPLTEMVLLLEKDCPVLP
ncbi:MAG: RNA pseudouridine synthase [Proteobacteria bacterium]|nr:RNA pseudouridine synthase [Pseudomonadota bacterium]MBU1584732.1 RNA pseudouridine synthase [Pseudomonadota bacterium]MBU2454434.1 RNA pseudouridine synthase [Pseudomonadota bacterium]MBU2630859.1 RNA pseudouridine synthase [Pseudomonadota bacterium]